MSGLAYLFPSFPVFHQTFVLWEVLGLRRNGLEFRIYSLKAGSEKQQPEGEAIAREVTYLPRLRSAEVWKANLRLFTRHPLRYLGLFLDVARAWRTGAIARAAATSENSRPLPLRDRLRGWYNRQPYLYLLKSWLLVPKAVELAERLQRDGVRHLHVHWATYPTTAAYIVKRITGIPYSFSAHAYDIYMITRMLPAKIREASFVATCARTNRDFLASLAGPGDSEKIHVNYHGVDVRRFVPPEQAVPRDRSAFRLISVGQLERYKGFHLLIDACADLVRDGISVDCQIAGEGPWRPILSAQIEKLGLQNSVKLLGSIPHSQLAELLMSADAFSLASEIGGKSGRRDVIANVLVEAMAAGLPVVATGIPGANELVVDGECGYVVPPNSSDAIASALRRLARDPAERQRLGAAARERVLRDFDNAKNVREMAELLTNVLDHPTARRA